MNNKKISLARVLALAVAMLCGHIHAQSLQINKLADLSFGTIDFVAPVAVGDITLATNATIIYGSNTSGPGFGTPGQLQLEGDAGTTLSIACSTDATLALPGNGTLTVTPVNFIIGSSNVGPYAMGTACAGLGSSVATHTLTATGSENTLFIGGNLATNGQSLANGTYSGTNSGGNMPAFRVIVQ